MTYIYRPGAYNVTDAARATLTQPGAAAAGAGSWWLGPWPGFPAAAAIPAANCAAAYRAVDTPGSVWGAGPANIAESYVNLNAPGVNDLTLVLNPPPWAAATGWQITSVNVCLKTGIIAATDSTWSIFMKYSDFTNPAVNPYLFGSQSVGGFYLRPGNAFGPGVRYSNGGLLTIVQAVGAGNLGIGGRTSYNNGVANAGLIGLNAGAQIENFIGCYNAAGVPSSYAATKIQAVAIYNVTLDANQAAALGTAVTGAMAQL